MKDIITKIALFTLFALPTVINAKAYDSIDAIINDGYHEDIQLREPAKAPKKEKHNLPKKIRDLKLTKDKKGNFHVPWKILKEFNLRDRSIGKNLKKIINKSVVLRGFMIPIEMEKTGNKVKEFLLVPFIPTCAHFPPPPLNMTINVKAQKNKPINYAYGTVEVIGKLKVSDPKRKQINPYFANGIYSVISSNVKDFKR